MEMTISQRRMRHAEWARRMADAYRHEARTAIDERQKRLIENARRMDEEAEWAEKSAEYM